MYDMTYGDLAPENTLCGLPPRGVEPGTALFFDYTFSGLLKAGSAQLSPVGRPCGTLPSSSLLLCSGYVCMNVHVALSIIIIQFCMFHHTKLGYLIPVVLVH